MVVLYRCRNRLSAYRYNLIDHPLQPYSHQDRAVVNRGSSIVPARRVTKAYATGKS